MPLKNPDAPGIPVEFLDFTDQQDNSSYVLDLMQGILQPCEVVDEQDDVFLQNIDVQKLIQELQVLTGTVDIPDTSQESEKSSRFAAPVAELEIAANVTKRLVVSFGEQNPKIWLCAEFFSPKIWSSDISNDSA